MVIAPTGKTLTSPTRLASLIIDVTIMPLSITGVVLGKGRNRRAYVLSLPVLCLFLGVWALGEGIGALLGPGNSLERLE